MKFRQTLFWDVNPKNIDTKKHSQYIIERILDLGNDKEVKNGVNSIFLNNLQPTINN
jgi:hypothetical protein